MSTKTVILFIVVSTILTKLAKEQTDIPNENVIGNVVSSFTVVSFKSKFLKRRLLYSTNHSGSYNPTVISNQEAHMIYGNMDGKKQQKTGATKKISDFFLKQQEPSAKGLFKELRNVFFDRVIRARERANRKREGAK